MIIAGPNGAGKTTFAREFLPRYADCTNFINADLIAQGFAPLAPETVAIRAGRTMLHEIEQLMTKREDFGFETTLAGRSYLKLFERLEERDYKIHLFFLSIPSARLALSRIKGRVQEGGHDVPKADVYRRFNRSFTNFLVYYRKLADSWILFDASEPIITVIASQNDDELLIMQPRLYRSVIRKYEKSI